MLFKIVNNNAMGGASPQNGAPPAQFCGVLEFSAPDEKVFAPYWMMQNLLLSEGDRVELRSICRPPTGSFVRFRPHDRSFLSLAALQGPRVFMETALRHYSALSEGVTILVEHEGDAHYLEVEEVRARGSPVLREADREQRNHEAGEVKFPAIDDGGSCNERRVSLVSLLGDLDLKVEFSSGSPGVSEPRPGSDATDSAEHPTQDDEDDIVSRRLLSLPSCTHSRTEVARDRRGQDDLTLKTERFPLPPPVKATEDGSVTSGPRRSLGVVERRHSSTSSHNATPGPSAPFLRRSISRSRFKAFWGHGRALGTLQGEKARRETDDPTSPVRRMVTTLSPSSTREAEETRTTRKASPGKDRRHIRKMTLKAKMDAALPERGIVLGEGPNLNETTCAAGGTLQRDAEVQSAMVACATCRKGIPEANYQLHRLRCPGAPIPVRHGESRSPNRSSISQACKPTGKPMRGVEQIRDSLKDARGAEDEAHDLADLHGRSGDESGPLEEDTGSTPGSSRGSTEPPRVQSSTAQREEDIPEEEEEEEEEEGEGEEEEEEEEEEENDTYTRPVRVGRDTIPQPKQRTAPRTSCEFCGLSFRDASATSAHENLCSARTDLCDHCCSLVPRREARSHRRPGGECDANIAKASALEHALTVPRDAGMVRGPWSADEGGDSATRRGQPSNLRFGSSLVDRLLAEAVRSSRQASIALQSVREENERLLAIGGGESRSRGSSVLKPGVDRNVPGRSVGVGDSGESSTRDKRVVDKGLSAKDRCAPGRRKTVAKLKAEVAIPLVPQSPARAAASRESKVNASVTLPEDASKSRTSRYWLESGQGTTSLLEGHCRRGSTKIAASLSTRLQGESSAPGVSRPPLAPSPIRRHSRSTSGVSPRSRVFFLPPVLERQHDGRDLTRVGSRALRRAPAVAYSNRGAEHCGRGASISIHDVFSASSLPSPHVGLDGARRTRPTVGERAVPVVRGEKNKGERLLFSCHGAAAVPESCKGPRSPRITNRMLNAGSQSANDAKPMLRNTTMIAPQSVCPGPLPSASLPTPASRGGTTA